MYARIMYDMCVYNIYLYMYIIERGARSGSCVRCGALAGSAVSGMISEMIHCIRILYYNRTYNNDTRDCVYTLFHVRTCNNVTDTHSL